MFTRTSARRRSLGVAVAVAAIASALVLPLLVATDAQAAPDESVTPSVFWNVIDRDTGAPVGGAAVRLEFTNSGSAGNLRPVADVVDCTQRACAEGSWGDVDPAPGEFQVRTQGNGNRVHRVTLLTAPAGYELTTAGQSFTVETNDFSSPVRMGTFELRRISWPDVPCTGSAFALLDSGAVRQASTSGSTPVLDFGGWSRLRGEANALAAGPASRLFAVDRTDSVLHAILRYDTTAGWQRAEVSTPGGAPVIVAGAFDRAAQRYLFGGFVGTGTSQQFRLYEYTVSNAVSLLGTIATGSAGDTTARSGDMAFDGTGSLVVVRAGSTSTVTEFRVTAAALAAASGGTITATAGATREVGLTGIAGAAYAADGSLLLSNLTTLRSYPATGGASIQLTSALGPRVSDLATCAVPAAPATLAVSLRAVARDQVSDAFQVLATGPTALGPVATGDAAEVQVGPSPVAPGTYSVRASVTTGDSAYYAPRIACTGVSFTPVDAWTATVAVPAGTNVACAVTVTPLRTVITVSKGLLTPTGVIAAPTPDWLMTIEATAGTTTLGPLDRRTGEFGVTSPLSLLHPSVATTARIMIEEQTLAAFTPESVSCVTTAPGASPVTTSATATTRIELVAVPAGSVVECSFLNREKPTTLTLAAAVGFGGAAPTEWQLAARGPQGEAGPSGATGSGGASAPVVKGLEYTLAATGNPAYSSTWNCLDQYGHTVPVTEAKVTVPQGTQATCTVTLTTARLTLLKHIEGESSTLLASAFTLSATPVDGVALLPTAAVPGNEALVLNGSGVNTFDVLPAHDYRLAEATTYAALDLRLERYSGGFPSDGIFFDALWEPVGIDIVQVAATKHDVYRFVSAAPTALALPLTGGVGADSYFFGGAGMLMLGLLAVLVLLVRTRICSVRLPRATA